MKLFYAAAVLFLALVLAAHASAHSVDTVTLKWVDSEGNDVEVEAGEEVIYIEQSSEVEIHVAYTVLAPGYELVFYVNGMEEERQDAEVDGADKVFHWQAADAQDYVFAVVLFRDGCLSDTKCFEVTVTEVEEECVIDIREDTVYACYTILLRTLRPETIMIPAAMWTSHSTPQGSGRERIL